jgi:biopolymer transport protein ExbB
MLGSGRAILFLPGIRRPHDRPDLKMLHCNVYIRAGALDLRNKGQSIAMHVRPLVRWLQDRGGRAWAHAGLLLLLLLLLLMLPFPAAAQDGAPADLVPQPAPLPVPQTLPRDLSPWGMFKNADPIVQGVLIGLVIASVVTWTIWLAKTVELLAAKRRLRTQLAALARARSTAEGVEQMADGNGEVRRFVDAAMSEWRMSAGAVERDGLKERIASRLERLEAAFARRITRGTGVLATIGATAPFVGLAGTVWGIMNSFIGISKSHTTNLAVVAPGIAEALLATALGLAAAIPAVVIYNVFARQITGYRAQLGDASAEVLRMVSRDLDRPAAQPPSARRASALSTAAE